MFGRIPVENWDYKVSDMVGGLAAALGKRKSKERIDILGIGSCFTTRSGRSAIVAAIKAFDLPSGAHIGVPLYSCPVVFKAIEKAGCRKDSPKRPASCPVSQTVRL